MIKAPTTYYLGLDMGTSSVGWAVTDPQYQLIRRKGKDLWGIREFEEAESSVTRRTNRVSRRRRARETYKIGKLKMYFEDAIKEVDPYFYQRLDNSKYYLEDKDEEVASPNGIFDDAEYTDKDYYEEFPTIFHLRKALLENDEEEYDVRLVYLALLNMFKHRGHFLNTSLGDNGNVSLDEVYAVFISAVSELMGIDYPIEGASVLEETLTDRSISRSAKAEKIAEQMGIKTDRKNKQYLMIRCICGLDVDAKLVFDDLESEEKVKINFSDYGYEDKCAELQEVLGDDNYSLVENMKALYDAGSLAGILKGYTSLSAARVAEYEKHKKDLAILKKVYKEKLSKAAYDKMFRSDVDGTYSAYVGSVNSNAYLGKAEGKLRRDMKGRSREDLYKKIKADLKGLEGDSVTYILREMENETFLPKQLTAGNGIIPNQIHRIEMKKILANAEQYLPFLLEKDETGLTVSRKILELFSWQIPYYIGPVTENSKRDGGNGWVIRKESGEVLPWNMTDKIDDSATRTAFIQNLIRECSYLTGEKVLPKSSLLYEKYCVLNEINNIRIDGERISPEMKQDIYITLFEKGKKVTRKALAKYLGVDDSSISGIDLSINNSLTSYGRFYPILGDQMKLDSTKEMVEDIIMLCTIYGDAKKLLKEEIQKRYGDRLSDKDIKRILGYKFKDWGRLSKAILNLNGVNRLTGEIMPLIQAMWETKYNFMELLNSDEFSYGQELEELKTKSDKVLSTFQAEDLDEYYFPAPVKRMVWQTLQIIKEIEYVMGCAPARVFIEMTRSDEEKGDKGRKNSRKTDLLELYKKIKKEDKDWVVGDMKKGIELADSDGSLRSKKLFLYYRQMGRCMYTGEPIDLDRLLHDNVYDIDHIYPRHYVKDDNIGNNLVLVNKASNAYKSDNYPIPAVPDKAKALWRALHDNGFVNDEKYRRLTGKNPFTEEQQAGFIARQLVETSQGTKGVADLLKQLLPETTRIVYSKASNVSEFRRDFDMLKCRSVNDLHHAKDAYLNIVVGNAYYVRFTQNPLNFIKKEYALDKEKYHYNLGKMFAWDIKRNDDVAWIASRKNGSAGTIETVKKIMRKNSPLMTRLSFEVHGEIANATLYSKRTANKNFIPIKQSDLKLLDVKKYGGFKGVKTSRFFLVEHGKANKRIRTIEGLPLYLQHRIDRENDGLERYCRDVLGLVNPDIRIRKIKIQSLLRIDGFDSYLTGRSDNQLLLRNAVNLLIPDTWEFYCKKIENSMEKGYLDSDVTREKNNEFYELLTQKHVESIFAKKKNPIGKALINGKEKFRNLSIEDQCFVLSQILLLTQIASNTADLSHIGGSKEAGRLRVSNNMTKLSSALIIYQSITGIFEEKINLKTV